MGSNFIREQVIVCILVTLMKFPPQAIQVEYCLYPQLRCYFRSYQRKYDWQNKHVLQITFENPVIVTILHQVQ